LLQFKLQHSRGGTPKHTQTVTDATQKENAIDQQQHSCEMMMCERHQTIIWFLSSAAIASTWWRVREFYSSTTSVPGKVTQRECWNCRIDSSSGYPICIKNIKIKSTVQHLFMFDRFAVQLPTLQCITTTVSDNNKQYRYISVLLL